jgi:hypothetical protein
MLFWLVDQLIETGDAERTTPTTIVAAVNAIVRMSNAPLSLTDCQYQ